MSLAKKLRILRLRQRMTIKELAALIQVPASTYRDWEYGRKISAEKISKLAEVFEVSINELMGEDEKSPKELTKAIFIIEEALQLLRKI